MWEEVRGRRSVPRKEWTERAWLCTSNRFQAESDGEIDPVYVEDSVPPETVEQVLAFLGGRVKVVGTKTLCLACQA